MPRTSCIEHPKRHRFFMIREGYVALFDDFCAASLLALFEYWTNGELEKMEREDIAEGEPWIGSTISEMSAEMLNFYSERTIKDSLKLLVQAGLLTKGSTGKGSRSLYLLNVAAVQDAIRSPMEFRKKGNFALLESDTEKGNFALQKGKNDDEIALLDGNLYKEEEERIKNIETPYSPSLENLEEPHTSDTDPEGSYEESLRAAWPGKKPSRETAAVSGSLIKTVMIRLKSHGIKINLRSKNREMQALCERVCSAAEAIGEEALLERLDDAFNCGETSLYRALTGIGFTGSRYGRPAAPKKPLRYPTSSAPPIATPAPSAPSQRGMIREYADKWNESVPSRKWVVWSAELSSYLAEKLCDPVFVEHFDKLTAKVEQIAAAGNGKAGFMDFSWVLKGGNWTRVLNGGMDWLLSRDEQTSKPAKTSKTQSAIDEAKRMFSEGLFGDAKDERKSGVGGRSNL